MRRRTGSTCARADRRDAARRSRASSARSGPTPCSSTATRTRRSPERRPASQRRSRRPRRGRPSQRRPRDARGAQPDRGRPHRRAPLRARRALRRDTRARRRAAGEIHVVGDVMADATRLFAPIARERSTILDQLGVEAGGYVVATVHREANVRPGGWRRIVEGLAASARPVILPAHPRTRARIEAERDRASGPHPRHRAARLPRLRGPRLAGRRDRDRLGRPAEGGVLVRRPLRHAAPFDRVGRHRRAGANVLVDDDPERIAAAVAGGRACRPSGPCCTATAMPRSESPPSSVATIARRAP